MRHEGRIKMGYYPTPLTVVDRIRSFISFPEEEASLLDPCCGEGLALERLSGDANAETFGIELDGFRADQAKDRLDRVMKGSYEDARITNNAFSCLYLNPPYDWEAHDESEGSRRKEKSFLAGTERYLRPEGMLIYIIPQTRMTKGIARILSYRFRDNSVFRFPDEDYESYRQIVLFGIKKRKGGMNMEEYDWLREVPYRDLEVIPFSDNPVYLLPASGDISLFRSNSIDEKDLETELENSAIWKRLRDYAGKDYNAIGRPPLPLHTGHLGLLLANGYLDGVVGEGDDRHVIRGKVEKITDTYNEYNGDILIKRELDNYRVSIKLLDREGNITTLM